jgi:tetratricopeptide (TPR) repeat protein
MIEGGVEEMGSAPDFPEDPKTRGEYILRFIHRKYLRAYSLSQTRMDTLLGTGRYNCVSSAVLYLIFASASGLTTRGVATRDHAFITLRLDNENIDVETTNPYGFDPGNRREFQDEFGKVTGFAYVPAKNYRDRTSINPLELVSLILSNRITELETRGRYAEAVPLGLNRMALLSDPGNTASSEHFPSGTAVAMDRIFNYGAFLLKAGRETEALKWAELGEQKYPAPERWREFINAAVNNLLLKMIKAGRIGEARDILALQASKLNPDDYDRFEAMLMDNELTKMVAGIKGIADVEALLALLEGAGKDFPVQAERVREFQVFALLKKAEYLAQGEGLPAAIAFIEDAALRYDPEPRLQANLKTLRNKRVAELHNNFAAAYNKRNYAEARNIIEKALEEYPDNPRLLSDAETVRKAENPPANSPAPKRPAGQEAPGS